MELVRGTFDAMRRGDYRGATRGFHADAVWHNTAEFPGTDELRWPAGLLDFWTTLMESFEESTDSSGIDRVVEGEDCVVIGVHSVGRGKASGLPIDVHWGAAFHLRDGKISRVDVHGDWAKALTAAGVTG